MEEVFYANASNRRTATAMVVLSTVGCTGILHRVRRHHNSEMEASRVGMAVMHIRRY